MNHFLSSFRPHSCCPPESGPIVTFPFSFSQVPIFLLSLSVKFSLSAPHRPRALSFHALFCSSFLAGLGCLQEKEESA